MMFFIVVIASRKSTGPGVSSTLSVEHDKIPRPSGDHNRQMIPIAWPESQTRASISPRSPACVYAGVRNRQRVRLARCRSLSVHDRRSRTKDRRVRQSRHRRRARDVRAPYRSRDRGASSMPPWPPSAPGRRRSFAERAALMKKAARLSAGQRRPVRAQRDPRDGQADRRGRGRGREVRLGLRLLRRKRRAISGRRARSPRPRPRATSPTSRSAWCWR